MRNAGYVTGFTCPGSGSQTVKELSAYVKSLGGTPGNIRVVVYSAAHSKICEGSAQVSVNSTTAGWRGHLDQASISPNPATLVGGTQYDIGVTFDGADTDIAFTNGSAGDYTYGAADYTGGWPASLADGSSQTERVNVRCGVDPTGYAVAGVLSFGGALTRKLNAKRSPAGVL
jgi:hypothetical protein